MYFSINGINIELMDPPNDTLDFLAKEIGFFKLNLIPEDFEIAVEFVDKVNAPNKKIAGDVFLSKNLLFVSDSNKNKLGVSIDVSKKTKVVCEKRFNSREFYGWLEKIINYRIIKTRAAFLHASSFAYKGKGVTVCAWINGGKTNALLHFLSKGAEYLSDEFTMINEKGEILAYPKRIDLRDFNLMVLPGLLKNLGLKSKVFFRLVLLEKRILRSLYNIGFKSIAKAGLDVAFSKRMAIKEIFPNLKALKKHRVDKIFFLLQSNVLDAEIKPMGKNEFVNKISATNIFERVNFTEKAKAYSFLTGEEIDFGKLHKTERAIISNAVKSKEIYEVLIPKRGFIKAMEAIENII